MTNREEIKRTVIEPGIKAGVYFRLLPRHEVYACVWGSDKKRYLALVKDTWKRLPLYERRLILKYWRDHQLFTGVAVEVLPPPFPWDTKFATCLYCGTHLSFWAEVFDLMPDEVAHALIAHELAHVYHWAEGDDLTDNSLPGFVEAYADNMVEEWGFDLEALEDWRWQHPQQLIG
jgi:hypothetical protein